MATAVQQPSKAERFQVEAEPGAGADGTILGTNVDWERGNGKPASPSDSSDAVAVPQEEKAEEEKVEEEKKRSKGRTVLLLGGLCVRVIILS